MQTSSPVIKKARHLAAAGHHAEVVSYLGARAGGELEDSPTLALVYGTAQARLGHHEEGVRWLDVALDRARKRHEHAVERHALNARGAVALVSGRIDEAADYFAQAEADEDRTLLALTLRGRSEIRVVRRELEAARRDHDRVREVRRGLLDTIGEAEDLRVAAALLAAEGQLAAAERTLREVVARA